MKRVLYAGVLGAVVLLSTGCGSKEPQLPVLDGRCVIEGTQAPLWVCGEYRIPGVEAAAGSAPLGRLGERFAHREALANARSGLAQRLRSRIAEKAAAFADAVGAENGKAAADAAAEKAVRSVIGDAEELKQWRSPSKALYVLAGIPSKTVDAAARNAVREVFERRFAAAMQTPKAREAFERMFPLP